MKKTFRFLLIGIVAVSMVFISCKDDEENPEDNQQTEQVSFSFTLEGMTSWQPKGILTGYEAEEPDPLIYTYASKNMTLAEMMTFFSEDAEASILPEDFLMFGTIGRVGTHTANGNFVTSDEGETAILYVTGQIDLGEGVYMPTGWTSETTTFTITKLDLTEMKFSANISATMRDLVYLYSDGAEGVSDSRAFTATCKDLSFIDVYAMYGK